MKNIIRKKPPFKCVFCNSSKNVFSSKEHIVPQSLGNNFLILEKGWICDTCNNICSSFESKALNHSHLGFSRAMQGVITKKGKPARSKINGIHWNAVPSLGKNSISVDKQDLEDKPFLKNSLENGSAFILTVHNEYDIAKLFLKIGIETKVLTDDLNIYQTKEAIEHIFGINDEKWPYFIITSENISKHIVSIFDLSHYIHSHALASGFDIYFNFINNELILFFKYDKFKYAINLCSRDLDWIDTLKKLDVSYVGCPIEFVKYSTT